MSSRSDFPTVVDRYPLPPTTEGIVEQVRAIINEDGSSVLRVELDNEKGIRVLKMIQPGPEGAEDNVTLDMVLRGLPEFLEYHSEGASPYQILVDMMLLVQANGRHCTCWATGAGNEKLLEDWLELANRGMPTVVDKLCALPIERLKSLPEETLILVGSDVEGALPEELSFAVKTTIEVTGDQHEGYVASSEVADQVGDGAGGSYPPASQLACSARGLRRSAWNPKDHPRKRVGNG